MKKLLPVGCVREAKIDSSTAAPYGHDLSRPGVRSRISRSAGFTLIELMIVVAIIAILTAIAYPAYTNYITKTRRVAAEGCLSEYSNYMERYYTTNMSYAQVPASGSTAAVPLTLPTLDCAVPQRTGANYSYPTASASVSATGYTIRAVPVANSAQARKDTQCGTLSIDQLGRRNVSGPGGVAKCW